MKSKTTLLIAALTITALATSAVKSVAQILTFDNLPTPAGGGESSIPNGYGNFTWSDFNYLDGAIQVPSGFNNAVVSPDNVAFNVYGGPGEISGRVFNLYSAYLTAGWNDGSQVEVTGFVGSTLTYDNTYAVYTSGPTFVTFNYLGVDEVIFKSSGGTPNPSYTHGQGFEFAMDNLSVSPVPEPSPFALGAVILLICWHQRRIRCLT